MFALSLPTVGVDVDQQVFGSAGWGKQERLCYSPEVTSVSSARVLALSRTGGCELLSDAADPQLTQGLIWTGEGDLSAPPAVALTPLHIQHWNGGDTSTRSKSTDFAAIDSFLILEGGSGERDLPMKPLKLTVSTELLTNVKLNPHTLQMLLQSLPVKACPQSFPSLSLIFFQLPSSLFSCSSSLTAMISETGTL